ncbi:MAG: hypothetical protein K8I82_01035, partial [Anaerolineae bacterium]|nr:hypothetical protein [Anaerolineae bacterium]
ALESYRVDMNAFPWPTRNGQVFNTSNHIANVMELTTPVAYIGSVMMEDPFIPQKNWNNTQHAIHPTYVYVNYRGDWGKVWGMSAIGAKNITDMPDGYGMTSQGPDDRDSGGVHYPLQLRLNNVTAANASIYEPSNGLRSLGDIVRFGGSVPSPATAGGGG